MGNSHSEEVPNGHFPVCLNVYNTDEPFANTPGFGIFHSGVVVHGTEYTFAGHETSHSTGVFSHPPQKPPPGSQWQFKEQVFIGNTKYTKPQVGQIVDELKRTFIANTYSIVSRNCNHFADALCVELTGKNIPGWVNRAAKVGNTLKKIGLDPTPRTAEPQQPPAPAVATTPEMADLFPYTNAAGVECLNCTSESVARVFAKNKKRGLFSLFTKEEKQFLESDTDEQLLIHVPFTQNVKLNQLQIFAPPTAGNASPKGIKLFANQPSLNFDDVSSCPPAQEFTLPLEAAAEPLVLKVAKFANVNHLTIFVESNYGSATTRIASLALFGVPLASTNMKQLS
eukprot:TRINITY_DN7682_c0_g1_i1.p2 TRINITY_DN7682_c0_g1~~TRINITY_DN7682_c0_g1_i1.p2  ORF type:complete len:340 (+),score=106.47 TRINITY_DN7682_c0_g1_i1:1252-2271(+)